MAKELRRPLPAWAMKELADAAAKVEAYRKIAEQAVTPGASNTVITRMGDTRREELNLPNNGTVRIYLTAKPAKMKNGYREDPYIDVQFKEEYGGLYVSSDSQLEIIPMVSNAIAVRVSDRWSRG